MEFSQNPTLRESYSSLICPYPPSSYSLKRVRDRYKKNSKYEAKSKPTLTLTTHKPNQYAVEATAVSQTTSNFIYQREHEDSVC